jgi:ubiquinone/menaquinone biosynthesis C-methylase UbiE
MKHRVRRWSTDQVVSSFATAPPNPVLLEWVAEEVESARDASVLDLGCGAGRNAVPIAHLGCAVYGVDLSLPMLDAADVRAAAEDVSDRLRLTLAPMERLPFRDRAFDLVIAHGIWNLARSSAEFRAAVREAARVARPGAGLFVFTFARLTLPADATPVAGERFVFTQFSGEPQVFLTEDEVKGELAAAGFAQEPGTTLTEYNRPRPGTLVREGPPVIYEGIFRREA